jgi:Zn finger protein HypA/HybF involved in hydrogenase expression
MVKVRIPRLACLRCGHHWVPQQEHITMCPRCKSKLWETPRTTQQGMRSDLKAGRKRAVTRKRP